MRKLVIFLFVFFTSASINSANAVMPAALFGTAEIKAASLDALPKWQTVMKKIDREQASYDACRKNAAKCPSKAVAAWIAMLDSIKNKPQAVQVEKVNSFLNKWRYRTDSQNYGRSDYWASPVEFLARSGDCEDYAIAKYVSLRSVGFTVDQLRMVVVRDTIRDLNHAILAVYLDNDVVILDNVTPSVRSQDRVTNYAPYYSVNENARWAHVQPGKIILSLNTSR